MTMALNELREWVTLAEAAETLGTTEDALIHLGGRGHVQLCAVFVGGADKWLSEHPIVPFDLDTIAPTDLYDPGINVASDRGAALAARMNELRFPMPPDVCELSMFDLREMERKRVSHVAVSEVRRFDGQWWYERSEPLSENSCRAAADIIMLTPELERLSSLAAEDAELGRPQQVMRAREDAVLKTIQEMGLDPKALPEERQGRAGVRSKVRARLEGSGSLFTSRSAFDHAWQGLRDSGDIVMVSHKPSRKM